jgi:hypothetical protein
MDTELKQERLLEADLEVRNKFRTIIYESRQGERTDLLETTSYGDRKKLESELSQTQKSVIREPTREKYEYLTVFSLRIIKQI